MSVIYKDNMDYKNIGKKMLAATGPGVAYNAVKGLASVGKKVGGELKKRFDEGWGDGGKKEILKDAVEKVKIKNKMVPLKPVSEQTREDIKSQ